MVTRPINLTAALKCDLIASRCQHFQVDREAASPRPLPTSLSGGERTFRRCFATLHPYIAQLSSHITHYSGQCKLKKGSFRAPPPRVAVIGFQMTSDRQDSYTSPSICSGLVRVK